MMRRAAAAAVQWLRAALGAEEAGWTWGKLHTCSWPHAMAPVSPLLDGALSFGPHAIGGDTDTVMQTAISKESSDFTNLHNWAPSYRQIVDLGNLAADG